MREVTYMILSVRALSYSFLNNNIQRGVINRYLFDISYFFAISPAAFSMPG